MTELILQDRTLATKWSITISDKQISFVATSGTAASEPIFQDNLNASNYWKIFIDNGQFGFESTATVQDDNITLLDAIAGISYTLFIYGGEFGFEAIGLITENWSLNSSIQATLALNSIIH